MVHPVIPSPQVAAVSRLPRPPERPALRVARAVFPLLLLPILVAVWSVSVLRPLPEQAGTWMPLLALASAAWLAALGIARGGGGDLRAVVAGAIALRLLALAGSPELSDDVYRYAWEGELVASGVSPYAYAPDAPELELLRAARADLYARLNHPDVSAAYPPLAQALFAAHWVVADRLGLADWAVVVRLLRVFFALCDLALLWPLVVLLRRRGLSDGLAVAWGWCPLVALEFAGSAHFDSAALLLMLGALAVGEGAARRGLVPRGRELLSLVLLAGATLTKVLPLCAAPFLVRGRAAWLRALLFAALIAGGFLPVVLGLTGGAQGLGRGLGEYGLRWEHSGLVYGFLEDLLRRAGLEQDGSWFDARRVGRGVILALWLGVALLLWRRRAGPTAAAGTLVAAFLVLTPTLHPWYIAWIVPFLALAPRPAFGWLAAGGVLLYWAPVQYALEGRYEVPAPYLDLVRIPFAVLLLFELRAAARA